MWWLSAPPDGGPPHQQNSGSKPDKAARTVPWIRSPIVQRSKETATTHRRPERVATLITGATVILVLLVGYGGFSYYERERPGGRATGAVLPVTVSTAAAAVRSTPGSASSGSFPRSTGSNWRASGRRHADGDLILCDGQIVHKGDLLFVIDPRPYEIKLAHGECSAATATARVALANNQLSRAQSLRRNEFGHSRRRSISAPTTRMRRWPQSKTPRPPFATPS